MSTWKTTLARILSIAIGLLLLPVFAFIGLVLIGIAAVAGIIGSVALSRRMNQMRAEMADRQKSRFRGDKFKNGPIIDGDVS